ncbi:MAG: CHAD domain-containing protein [Acidimicrobiales bacterium]
MATFLTHHSDSDDIVAALRSQGFAIDDEHAATCTVLDTFDGRLFAAGHRLELRTGATQELVLHGAGDTPPAHLSWERPAPGRPADLPVGPFRSRISQLVVERALLPILEIASTSRRAIRVDRRGKPTTAATIHHGLALTPSPPAPPPRLVVELVPTVGHDSDASADEAALVAVGLERHDAHLVPALAASTGFSLAGHRSSPTVPLRRSDDAFDAMRAVARNLLTSMHDNLPGTLENLDPEFLHDLRVAIRRTRVVLGESKHVLPSDVRDRYRAEFKQLAAATGRTRDLDVYVLGWDDQIAWLELDDPDVATPLRSELEARRRAAHAAMSDVLRSDATHDLLTSWGDWLDDPDAARPHDLEPRPIGPHVADRIAKAQASLLADGRAITPDSPAERLHDLRKDAKKLRYLFECFGSVLPTKGRKAFVRQLKDLQDNLGAHQDAEVQVAELRDLAHVLRGRARVDTDALLTLGRLIDRLERQRQSERDDFAARFTAYDSPANHELLATVLAKAAAR